MSTGEPGLTGVDGVGILVGDLNAELLLDGHDDFDGVEAVEAEIVGEVSSGLDLDKEKFGLDFGFGMVMEMCMSS